jgi:hypothetical protein
MRTLRKQEQYGWSHVETVLAVLVFAGLAWFLTSPERATASITPGMSRTEALAAMGKPAKWEGKSLAFCDKGEWNRCPEATKSGAKTFLIWQTFVDAELVVGICGDDRVCFVAQKD